MDLIISILSVLAVVVIGVTTIQFSMKDYAVLEIRAPYSGQRIAHDEGWQRAEHSPEAVARLNLCRRLEANSACFRDRLSNFGRFLSSHGTMATTGDEGHWGGCSRQSNSNDEGRIRDDWRTGIYPNGRPIGHRTILALLARSRGGTIRLLHLRRQLSDGQICIRRSSCPAKTP